MKSMVCNFPSTWLRMKIHDRQVLLGVSWAIKSSIDSQRLISQDTREVSYCRQPFDWLCLLSYSHKLIAVCLRDEVANWRV
jgi:hypothetical protein